MHERTAITGTDPLDRSTRAHATVITWAREHGWDGIADRFGTWAPIGAAANVAATWAEREPAVTLEHDGATLAVITTDQTFRYRTTGGGPPTNW
ncbi:hypothetical protein GCM10009639_47570 [Kitasatospora putterlickiae]|uniref:Uncharacterized protein n=1 Tax=Kitasatospora putterlickiae TaxID=221725 RepID=A0ABN1YBE6_9ACTN